MGKTAEFDKLRAEREKDVAQAQQMKREHDQKIAEFEKFRAQHEQEVLQTARTKQENDKKIAELDKLTAKQAKDLEHEKRITKQKLEQALNAKREADAKMKAELQELQRKKEERERQLQRERDAAAAQGGGLMGAFVDLTTLISKPISYATYQGSDFDADWNKALGTVKKFCIV